MTKKQSQSIKFLAEIKSVASSKSQSLDRVFKLTVASDDPALMSLGVLEADQLVEIEVRLA